MAARTDGGLEAARILILDGPDAGTEIAAMFNPTEYSLSKSVQYGDQAVAGRTSPVVQFVSGDAETLSMELFFDASHGGSATPGGGTGGGSTGAGGSESLDLPAVMDRIDNLLTVDATLGAPPRCKFVWGTAIEFESVLESAEKQFTMFSRDGTPTRARVNVTFKEYVPVSNPEDTGGGGGGGDQPRQRTVTEGDTLWELSKQEYGDPTKWRQIADENGVENPRTLQPGTTLTIPPRSS